MRKEKNVKFSVRKYEPSPIKKFRDKWYKKGYDLIDITKLCKFRLGNSGWCNEFNEPDEEIYHIKCLYRGEEIASFSGIDCRVIDDDKYLIRHENKDDPIGTDFIIFRKVKI